MSEDEMRRLSNEEQEDEVEAHRRVAGANDEAGDETEGDEVEGHMRRAASKKL